MNRKTLTIITSFSLCFQLARAQQRRIIDMHIHSYDSSAFAHPINDPTGHMSSVNVAAHFKDTYGALQK